MPGFITARLAGPIAAGVAALLLAALIWVGLDSLGKNKVIDTLRDQVHDLTTEKDALIIDLAQCRANRITLEDAARRQNAAVEAARAEGAARIARLDAMASEARRSAASARARAEAILARPRTGNACADAEALIRETVR